MMHDGLLIDALIIAVLVVATATGLSRGILREVLSLSLWLLAILAAVFYFDTLSAWLEHLIADAVLRGWVIVVLIILAAAALLTLVDVRLRRIYERAWRGSHDPLLGLVFGSARGIVVVTLVVVLAHRTALPDRLGWHQSQFVSYAEALALSIRPHLPPEVAKQIVLRGTDISSKQIVLPRDSRGHYIGQAWLNGMPVNVLVDTGATMVMIPAHLQDKLGLSADASFPVNTATGQTIAQHTVIDAMKIGPVLLHDVQAALVETPKNIVLVGMSFLLHTRFRQTADGLLIEQARPSFD